MAWHTPEYKRYLKSKRLGDRKTPTTAGTASVLPAASGCGFHHFTYDSLGHEPIGDLASLCMPAMSMPYRAHQSSSKIFESRGGEIVRIVASPSPSP